MCVYILTNVQEILFGYLKVATWQSAIITKHAQQNTTKLTV